MTTQVYCSIQKGFSYPFLPHKHPVYDFPTVSSNVGLLNAQLHLKSESSAHPPPSLL